MVRLPGYNRRWIRPVPGIARKINAPTLFDAPAFQPLFLDPAREVRGTLDGVPYSAAIAIADYGDRVARHYRDIVPDGLKIACAEAEIPFGLTHFGLVVSFARPVEFGVHDEDMVLDDSIRALIARFGPVIFRNARIAATVRDRFHRNIFPHLRFHVDRGSQMPNQYSCFTRDPSVSEQRAPRASSTLFAANLVAWLEQVRCSGGTVRPAGVRSSYDIFHSAVMAPLLGNIILEQPWAAPDGTGEICVIDNRTVLHASYYKDGSTAGYPIGARYLF